MKLTDLIKSVDLSLDQVVGSDKALLVEVAPDRVYQDGKPTGEIKGTRYTIVSPVLSYDKVVVKVPGPAIVTQEELGKANGLTVTFKGFSGHFYIMDGKPGLTCKADSVSLVK